MLLSAHSLSGQNLVPNPSFETYIFCPNSSGEIIYAAPWFSPTNATPDYFHSCATALQFSVPVNYFGYQEAHSGDAYAGAFWVITNTPYREYISTPLTEPLVAGKTYSVSFFVNIADHYCGVSHCGLYFSNSEPDQNNNDVMNVIPQISYSGGFLNDYDEWVKISGCYQAVGGEQFITIGNFNSTASSPTDPACSLDDHAYYLIDDVVVQDMYDLELGGPYLVCDQYVIDPGIPDGDYLWSDGSTGSTLTVIQSGIYSVTISTACSSVSDEVEVIVHGIADVDLGPDVLTICEGETYTFHLEPEIYNYVWQDGNTGPEYEISEPGTYAVTMDDGCHVTTDEVQVNQDFSPEYDFLGDDVHLCPGDDFEIEFDPEFGEYLWQDSSTTYLYTISHAGNYALTISNACGEFTDELAVLPLYLPEIDLGPDTLILCNGQPYFIVLDPELGQFHWQDGSDQNSYSFNSPGIYAVTVTNDCGPSTKQIVIQYHPPIPDINLGPDTSLCPGEQLILSTSLPGIDLVWQDESTADTFLITQAGTYYVHAFDQCTSVSDTIQVLYSNNPPQLSLPPSINLCQGDTITLDAGISGVHFLWNDDSQGQTIIVASPGSYSLTVSNSCGSDIDTIAVMDGGPTPFISLGDDVSFCEGDTFLLSPSFSDVSSWLWNNGSSLTSYIINDAGVVSVQVSNSCGIAYDTLVASLLPVTPVIDLGTDTSLCPGSSLLLTINTPGVNIEWSDGSVNPQLMIDTQGSYYATISNSCGTNADTIVVDILPDIPAIDLGADQSLCPGEVITLDPGIQNVTYLWQDGSTDTFFLADHDQTVMLTISNVCGSSSDTLIVFTSTNGPDVDLGPDIVACEGESVTVMSDITGVDFLWQDGSSGSSYTTTSSAVISLQVSNACGMDSDTIMVDVHGAPPLPDLGPDSTLCDGTTLTLLSNADSETTTTWQNGSTAPTFLVTQPGTFFLSQSNRCGENVDSIQITFRSLPVAVDLGPDTILCPGEALLLTGPLTTDDVRWQDGSNLNTFLASQAGIYSLTLSNACGMSTDDMRLNFDDQVLKFPVDHEPRLCEGDTMMVDVAQMFEATYFWNTGSTASSIAVIAPGVYSVTVRTECQQATDEFNVLPSEDCGDRNDIYIPNVITPNGDNVNDIFTIYTNTDLDILSMEGSIFDRWGNMVFSSKRNPFTWNGYFGDERLIPGVYVYKIKVTYVFNGKETSELFVGDVTIVR
ncbi:MAG: gliding motility-associated C-terminal domain-containing protein [Saprospiraceae bacterium]